MKEVFIISTGEIISGKTAGARRMINIARSLAYGNVNVNLCSLAEFKGGSVEKLLIQPAIYALSSRKSSESQRPNFILFLRSVNRFMKENDQKPVVFLYPTTFVFKDFIYLIYFKFLKGYNIFCDINELRTAIAFSSSPKKGIWSAAYYFTKSIKDYMIYKLSEFQSIFYDGIIVISESLGKYFLRYNQKMIRVPILCDSEDIIPDRELPVFNGKVFKICFAGYIKIEKEGFDLLLESLSEVNKTRQVELYLYGMLEDHDHNRLRQLSAKYGLTEKIHYKGNIPPANLQHEFLNYHLLILPRPLNKRTRFGFSTKLSDYLVSGRPVLLTDVSDNARYFKDNYNGYLVAPGSAVAMADKILDIIRNYNDQAKMIVENAYRTVREEFDYKLFSANYIDFLFGNEPNSRKIA